MISLKFQDINLLLKTLQCLHCPSSKVQTYQPGFLKPSGIWCCLISRLQHYPLCIHALDLRIFCQFLQLAKHIHLRVHTVLYILFLLLGNISSPRVNQHSGLNLNITFSEKSSPILLASFVTYPVIKCNTFLTTCSLAIFYETKNNISFAYCYISGIILLFF